MRIIFTLSLILWISAANAQSEMNEKLPYRQIPSYPENYKAGNVMGRFIDGLGYRYYWATEGLRKDDLNYKPTKDARSTRQTLEHIYSLSRLILIVANKEVHKSREDVSSLSFDELRQKTLVSLKTASDLFKGQKSKGLEQSPVVFEREGKQSEYSNWHLMNGPIADAIYHTGQIVSFRRSSGNPMNPKVNVFTGKTAE